MLFVKNVIKNKKYFYFNKLALVDVTISNEKNLLQQVIYMDNSMIYYIFLKLMDMQVKKMLIY